MKQRGYAALLELRLDECSPTLSCFWCNLDHCEHSLLIRKPGLGRMTEVGLHQRCRGFGVETEIP